MTDFEPLGAARLDLTADVDVFIRNIDEAQQSGQGLEHTLDALAAISETAERALKQVGMSPGQGAESAASARAILEGVRGISDEARTAAVELDKVKLTAGQAAESDIAGDVIDRKLKSIRDNAVEASAALDGVGGSGAASSAMTIGGTNIGLLGAGAGAAALLAPAAGPALLAGLAAVPAALATAAGAAGVLKLAFDGVTTAIGGNKTAFDALDPSAQQFVLTVRSLDGWLDQLRATAAGGLFPGLEEGLHSALSPGTVAAISTAVSELAHALGDAGAQWGKYFGSTEFQSVFGPLMQEAAGNVTRLSQVMLALADGVGVVARAAIPLDNWMGDEVVKGAQLADAWLHAKDASGALAGAMDEARVSLQLVAGLLDAVGRAVAALGVALYPVSKIAVKDLTDGLDAVARVVEENQSQIRELLEGSLAAFVATVKALAPLVAGLAHAAGDVANALGGWRAPIEALVAFKLASVVSAWIVSFGGLKTSLGAADAEAAGLRATLLSMDGLTIPITVALLYKEFVGGSGRNYDETATKAVSGGQAYRTGKPGKTWVQIPGRGGYYIDTPPEPGQAKPGTPTSRGLGDFGHTATKATRRLQIHNPAAHTAALLHTATAAASPFGTAPPFTSTSTGGAPAAALANKVHAVQSLVSHALVVTGDRLIPLPRKTPKPAPEPTPTPALAGAAT